MFAVILERSVQEEPFLKWGL